MSVSHSVSPSPDVPVWLFGSDGSATVFPSLSALANRLGKEGLTHFGLHFCSSRYSALLRARGPVPHRWIARQGATLVSAEMLRPLIVPPRSWWSCEWDHRRLQRPQDHRVGPVPGTGRRGGSYSDLLRSPRTQQLLREARFASAEEDGIPPVRPRLRHRPTRWDDRCRSDWDNRNWKHRRSHQWKSE